MKEKEDEKLIATVIPFEYNYHKRGRRTTCTPELALKVAEYMARGSTARDAALLAGISQSTFQKWRTRGHKEHMRLHELGIEDDDITEANPDEAVFLVFYLATQKAIPMRKALFLGRIEEAGRDTRQWQANAWMLERLHPDEFGRQTRIDIRQIDWREGVVRAIKDGLEFEIIAKEIGDEETRALFERARVEIPEAGAGGESSEDDTGNARTDP